MRAALHHLVGLGVGAVISGDIYGWQYGLAGGVGGLSICLGLATSLYLFLSFSIMELASRIGGQPFAFVQVCIGPASAYATMASEAIKCIAVVAVVTTGVASYVTELVGSADDYVLQVALWCAALLLIGGVNAVSTQLSINLMVAITLFTLALLVAYYITILAYLGGGSALGGGFDGWRVERAGMAEALPYSLWFYLGVEEVALAADEAARPRRDVPRALLIALATLVVLAVGTVQCEPAATSPPHSPLFQSLHPISSHLAQVLLTVAAAPSVDELAHASTPLALALRGVGAPAPLVAAFAALCLAGLLVSLHSFAFSVASK